MTAATATPGDPAATLPGFRIVDGVRRLPEDGLRNDVAAFLGSAERGPLGLPVRVDSRRAYEAVFGGQGTGTVPRAVAAYFANGGQVAWIVRAGRDGGISHAAVEFGADGAGSWARGGPARLALPGTRLLVAGTGPGRWADGTVLHLAYRAFGVSGDPELDVAATFPDGRVIRAAGLTPAEVPAALGSSGLLAASWDGPPVSPSAVPGPAALTWTELLSGGAEPVLDATALRAAIDDQAQVGEIALVCIPGLAGLLDEDGQDEVAATLAHSAAACQDRLAVLSVPATDAAGLVSWDRRVATAVPDDTGRRALAAYYPPLLAEDLTGTGPDRYSATDPVGHVCGRAAELDRVRGSGWSPANTLVTDAVDTVVPVPAAVQDLVLALAVNLIRPRVGGGLELWGARTRDLGDGRYLAHRRLLHRIVRGVRRVTEPLVFGLNDRLLQFTVARAVNGLLMETFRTGALQGLTPAEAYRVRCDETTNPPDVVDAGQLVCEIDVAPAAPMEFITLRLTLGAEGLLEVVEQ
jgi:phage tail sheath protein FI